MWPFKKSVVSSPASFALEDQMVTYRIELQSDISAMEVGMMLQKLITALHGGSTWSCKRRTLNETPHEIRRHFVEVTDADLEK